MKRRLSKSAFFGPIPLIMGLFLLLSCGNNGQDQGKTFQELPALSLSDFSSLLSQQLAENNQLEIRRAENDEQTGTYSLEFDGKNGSKFILWGNTELSAEEETMLNSNLHMLINPSGQGSEAGEGIGNLPFPVGVEPPLQFRQKFNREMSCTLHMTSGVISVLNGDKAAAQSSFESALKSCPAQGGGQNLFLAHYFIGRYKLLDGDVEGGRESLEQALMSSPDTTVSSNLEKLIARLEDKEQVNLLIQGEGWEDTRIGDLKNLRNGKGAVKHDESQAHTDENVEGVLDAPSNADSVYYQKVNRFGTYFRVLRGGDFGIVDRDGREIVPCEYLWIEAPSEGLAWIRQDSLYGYIDEEGKWIVPLQYQFAGDFSNSRGLIKLNELYGYLDKSGKVVIPIQFEDAEAFSEGFALVSKNGRYGFIRTDGSYLVEPRFGSADIFRNGLALVDENDKTGIIDTRGEWVLKPEYLSGMKIGDNWIFLETQNGYKAFQVNKKALISGIFNQPQELGEHGILYERNGKWGLLGMNGGELLPPAFDALEYAGSRLIKAREGNKFRVYFREGNTFQKGNEAFDDMGEAFLDRTWVKKGQKYGFVNENGALIIPTQYDSVGNFFNGMCVVWENGNQRFINLKGECILHCK